MIRGTTFVALMGVLAVLSGPAVGSEGNKDAAMDSPKAAPPLHRRGAASPAEAVKTLLEALKSGDPDSLVAALPKAHAAISREDFARQDELAAANKRLIEAVRSKLGSDIEVRDRDDRKTARELVREFADGIESFTIGKTVSDGELKAAVGVRLVRRGSVAPRESEEVYPAIKEPDGWKAIVAGMPIDASKLSRPDAAARHRDILAAIDRTIAKVNDGTLRDARSISEFMTNAEAFTKRLTKRPKSETKKD